MAHAIALELPPRNIGPKATCVDTNGPNGQGRGATGTLAADRPLGYDPRRVRIDLTTPPERPLTRAESFFAFATCLSPIPFMSRRQLNRPSPTLSLDQHLRITDQLPERLTSESLFGNTRPLELEIGSGKGLFIDTAAGRRPEHNFLGIEIAHKYATHAAGRLAKHDRSNALMVAGDAEPLLQKAIPDDSLAAVHIYFPDPWWKKKHKKRRVINPASVAEIYRALVDGGTFHFWTDVLEYFESAIEMIAAESPRFGPPIPDQPETAATSPVPNSAVTESAVIAVATEDAESPAIAEPTYRTHFDRRSQLHQIPVYRVRYEKHSDRD